MRQTSVPGHRAEFHANLYGILYFVKGKTYISFSINCRPLVFLVDIRIIILLLVYGLNPSVQEA